MPSGPSGTIQGCHCLKRCGARNAVGIRSTHDGRLCARSASKACTTSSAAIRFARPRSSPSGGLSRHNSRPPSRARSARSCRDGSGHRPRTHRSRCARCRVVLHELACGRAVVARDPRRRLTPCSPRNSRGSLCNRRARDPRGADPDDHRHAQAGARGQEDDSEKDAGARGTARRGPLAHRRLIHAVTARWAPVGPP